MPSGVQNPLWGYDKRYASTTTFLSTTTILKDFWFIDNTLCHYKVWYILLRERKDNYDFILRFSTKTNQSETTTNRNSTHFNYKTRKVDKLFEVINWFYNNYMIQKQWFGWGEIIGETIFMTKIQTKVLAWFYDEYIWVGKFKSAKI